MLDFEDFKREYQEVPVEEYPNNVLEEVPEPLVSVHISTYQHADFIRDCLDGVLMQETDFPIEILIGEDESDDGTREICKEYADRHPDKIRLFLHRRENNIKIHNRPTGRFQSTYTQFNCRGKYIAICEGDDYWTDPKKLQKQVGFLENNPEYVLSHHDASIVNSQGGLLESSKLPDKNKKDFQKEDVIKGPFFLTLSLCYRNILEGYPIEYFKVLNGDKFLISLLGQHGMGGYQKDVKPATYRKHPNSMWSMKPDISKDKILSNTLFNIKNYYARSGCKEIVDYFEKKYIKKEKSVYYRGLRAGKYKESVASLILVVKHYFSKNRYVEAIEYVFESARLFYEIVVRKRMLNRL
jgi:glycosyltransferase involved in cell wall biosynthesis